jgi:hypothetical protein
MAYWGQMFDLVVEIQKRLFTLIENQMTDVPGVKQAKAAMAMMPDLSKMQNVVSAMQGVMSSGGSAFESMQKVMGDFARMTGGKRRFRRGYLAPPWRTRRLRTGRRPPRATRELVAHSVPQCGCRFGVPDLDHQACRLLGNR